MTSSQAFAASKIRTALLAVENAQKELEDRKRELEALVDPHPPVGPAEAASQDKTVGGTP